MDVVEGDTVPKPVGGELGGGMGGVIEMVTAFSKSATETSDRSSAEISKDSMP